MQISVSMMIAHSASKCHSKNRQNVKKERGIACERGRFRPRVRRAARRGEVRSEMTFAAGECHTIFYELPLGRLTMELHTDSVCASFDGACGTLELCYRLTVRDETVSENRLTVTLAPR